MLLGKGAHTLRWVVEHESKDRILEDGSLKMRIAYPTKKIIDKALAVLNVSGGKKSCSSHN